MSTGAKQVLIRVTAALIVAAVLGLVSWASYGLGWRNRDEQFIRDTEAAPSVFANQLERVIVNAAETTAVADAMAIVSVRNDLRRSLEAVDESLNSDIDTLARLLQEYRRLDEEFNRDIPTGLLEPLLSRIQESIRILVLKWPAKKAQIEVEIRKLEVELGLAKRID